MDNRWERRHPLTRFVVLDVKDKGRPRYVRIHRASCPHAKEPNYRTVTTLCHGYFDTYPEVMDFARSLGDRVFECKICDPRHRVRSRATFNQ